MENERAMKACQTSVIMSPERCRSSVITETTNCPKTPKERCSVFPWNWSQYSDAKVNGSPSARSMNSGGTACLSSPETPTRNGEDNSSMRRGRPRADAITTLIIQGSTSPSSIRCKICNRVFPREKSVQAHMRTHTGERPYLCDFPGCLRRFAQSGQLKTHQRLHTGEKPFKCSVPNCASRFTHANRHCAEHPYAILKRDEAGMTCTIPTNENTSEEVLIWLQRYRLGKESLSPPKPRPRQLKHELDRADDAKCLVPTTHKAVRRSVIQEHNINNAHSSELYDESFYANQEGDQIMGALALIQLAKNATDELATPLNLSKCK